MILALIQRLSMNDNFMRSNEANNHSFPETSEHRTQFTKRSTRVGERLSRDFLKSGGYSVDFVRPSAIEIGKRSLSLPLYFPSISSVKTALRPMDYLKILGSFVGLNSQFLISAYDLAAVDNPEETKQFIKAIQGAGSVILMDSGNYESFWKNDQSNWKQPVFQKMLHTFPYDLAFCFDEQSPPSSVYEHIELVIARYNKDQSEAGDRMIIPIIHGSVDKLPMLCTAVAEVTNVSMLAVPERKLGDGVIERARSLARIRFELNKLGRYVILHLLGTGNPISIAIYSAMGADSFDGLEWCQTVVDHDTTLLYHLSQSDFFAAQTQWGDISLSFHARTLAHNLEFYIGWMQRLNKAREDNNIVDFCRFNFPERIFTQCVTAFAWE